MSTTDKRLIDVYIEWLRDHSSEREVGANWLALAFPFLDRHNDYLQVYVQEWNGQRIITDEGQTLKDLHRVGCKFEPSTKRRRMAEQILRSLGLDPSILDDTKKEIRAVAVNGEFPSKLHSVLLSMLAIDGLANVSQSNVAAVFKDDVGQWLNAARVPYTPDPSFEGRSGVVHRFDFLIPGNHREISKGLPAPHKPSRPTVLQAIPKPDKTNLQSFTYEVIDTREKLNGEAPDFIAVLNDKEGRNAREYRALMSHDIRPLSWSHRAEFVDRLV